MTTFELRKKLISKINQIDDEEILAEVNELLSSIVEEKGIYRITGNHKTAVEEAIIQIKKGEFLTDHEANQDINEWLSK